MFKKVFDFFYKPIKPTASGYNILTILVTAILIWHYHDVLNWFMNLEQPSQPQASVVNTTITLLFAPLFLEMVRTLGKHFISNRNDPQKPL